MDKYLSLIYKNTLEQVTRRSGGILSSVIITFTILKIRCIHLIKSWEEIRRNN